MIFCSFSLQPGGCMMLCSLLLLGVKIGSLPSARLRKEIVRKIKDNHPKEKVKEAVQKRVRPTTARSPGNEGVDNSM